MIGGPHQNDARVRASRFRGCQESPGSAEIEAVAGLGIPAGLGDGAHGGKVDDRVGSMGLERWLDLVDARDVHFAIGAVGDVAGFAKLSHEPLSDEP